MSPRKAFQVLQEIAPTYPKDVQYRLSGDKAERFMDTDIETVGVWRNKAAQAMSALSIRRNGRQFDHR